MATKENLRVVQIALVFLLGLSTLVTVIITSGTITELADFDLEFSTLSIVTALTIAVSIIIGIYAQYSKVFIEDRRKSRLKYEMKKQEQFINALEEDKPIRYDQSINFTYAKDASIILKTDDNEIRHEIQRLIESSDSLKIDKIEDESGRIELVLKKEGGNQS